MAPPGKWFLRHRPRRQPEGNPNTGHHRRHRPPRPQFVPVDVVRGKGTLYSLSREGVGTSGPLGHGPDRRRRSCRKVRHLPTRRAPPNTAAGDPGRSRERLPDQYSHYGSRGIILMTILQSWSQGVEVCNLEGKRKFWSASNVKFTVAASLNSGHHPTPAIVQQAVAQLPKYFSVASCQV